MGILELIILILVILWIIGLATSYTAGGLIHLLLLIAVIILVVRLVRGTVQLKKNEAFNFAKQYKNTICLTGCIKPIKLIDCVEEGSEIFCVILTEDGEKIKKLFIEPLIPLKGRLKNRDYDTIEARFHTALNSNQVKNFFIALLI